jgi:hypothetical protein
LHESFPQAHTFLLADTYRSERITDPAAPIFTLGFEFTHALMRQYIPSIEEWRSFFDDSVWSLVAVHELEIPYSAIFQLGPAEARL